MSSSPDEMTECQECGTIQADPGRGAACEDCGHARLRPIPAAEWRVRESLEIARKETAKWQDRALAAERSSGELEAQLAKVRTHRDELIETMAEHEKAAAWRPISEAKPYARCLLASDAYPDNVLIGYIDRGGTWHDDNGDRIATPVGLLPLPSKGTPA